MWSRSRLGTTSVHSSTHRPASGLVASILPGTCSTSDSLLAGNSVSASGGSPTQRSPFTNGSCATDSLRRSPVPSTSALRMHAPKRATVSRTRVERANQVFAASGSPAIACMLAASAVVSSVAAAEANVKCGSTTNADPNTAFMRSTSWPRRARGSVATGRARSAVTASAVLRWSSSALRPVRAGRLARPGRRRLLRPERLGRCHSCRASAGRCEASRSSPLPALPRTRRSALWTAFRPFSARTTRASRSVRSSVPCPVRSGGLRSSASAPRAAASSLPYRRGLLQRVEQRDLAGGQVGRTGVLQPQSRAGVEAASLVLGVIEHALLDLAQRRPGLRSAGVDVDAVHELERREQQFEQRQRARLGHSARRVVEPLDGAADLARIAEQRRNPGVERSAPPRRARTSSLAPSHFRPMRCGLSSTSSRCVSAVPLRGVCATSSSGGGASPCAMAASVPAMRDVLPRAIWYAASAVSASLSASTASLSAVEHRLERRRSRSRSRRLRAATRRVGRRRAIG